MRCPKCKGQTVTIAEGEGTIAVIVRTKQCIDQDCAHIITTVETSLDGMPEKEREVLSMVDLVESPRK